MTSVSLTGIGAIVTITVLLLKMLGIEVAETDVERAVEGFVAIVGVLALIYGQFRRKDLKLGLFRK